MKIKISSESISIDKTVLRYDTYYFAEHPATKRSFDSYLHIVKDVLSQWAGELENGNTAGSPKYLPFNLDDQSVDCLEVVFRDSEIDLTPVTVWADGFAVNLDDLKSFINGSYKVQKRTDKLGSFSTSDFVRALRNAEIASQ